jgi:hypothetical protein
MLRLWREARSEAEMRQDLQAVANAAGEARQIAEEVAAQAGPRLPEPQRQALAALLAQVPGTVVQSLKRPADPTGTSVPAGLVLSKPEHLLPFLPRSLPRFKPGDRPPNASDWTLTDLLGIGGFGEVWKADNDHLGETAAFKFCIDPSAAATLRNEAGLLRRVRTEAGKVAGMVALLDTSLSADPPWLRYEYVSGGDLAGLLADCLREPDVPWQDKATAVVRELAGIVF